MYKYFQWPLHNSKDKKLKALKSHLHPVGYLHDIRAMPVISIDFSNFYTTLLLYYSMANPNTDVLTLINSYQLGMQLITVTLDGSNYLSWSLESSHGDCIESQGQARSH